MSDALILFFSTVISAVLAFISNRASANAQRISALAVASAQKISAEAVVTKTAFDGLDATIKTLRNELNIEREQREKDGIYYRGAIQEQKDMRMREMKTYEDALTGLGKRLEAQFDDERRRYKEYINTLIGQLKEANITPADWETD